MSRAGSARTRATYHGHPTARACLHGVDARSLLGWLNDPHTGAVKPVLTSPEPRAPLPPIARQLTWTEWLLVAATWLALALTSAGTLTDNAQRGGIGVVFGDFLVLQVIDWAVWMALLWPLFAIFDATPLVRPKRL